LVNSATSPSAIELVTGPVWSQAIEIGSGDIACLLVGVDGSAAEVQWMIEQLTAELREQGAVAVRRIETADAAELWKNLREFPADAAAPLVIKASVRPSASVDFVRLVHKLDPQASIQAHAGTGIVIARFAEFSPADVSRLLIGQLQPAAVAGGGHVVVLSSAYAADLTRQAVWGGAGASTEWMVKVRHEFDPQGLLNPGRFVYGF
jgi:FAD/FMN-containing dehydrogenase